MSELRYRVAGALGGLALDALFGTLRTTVLDPDPAEPFRARGEGVIYVLWHGRLLPLAHHHRKQQVVTLVSRSGDGEYIARVLAHWGYGFVRGSSSRGGDRALRELVRLVRSGRTVSVTPDGPRGPREQVKPGALLVAQLTGRPLIPAAAGASAAWWFGKWDRFLVPKPFSTIRVSYGTPQFVPRDGGPEALENAARNVQEQLGSALARVDARG